MAQPTPYIFLWEGPDGVRRWEAVGEAQMEGFLQKLLEEDKVNPATVMAAYHPMGFHYVWKQFHGELTDVSFGNINETIYGSKPPAEPVHQAVDVPERKPEPTPKLGWLSPDGRHFACQYGDHAYMAHKIVGDMEEISDHECYLEDRGWAKIYRDPVRHCDTLGMGIKHSLTEAQFKTLVKMGLENLPGVSYFLMPIRSWGRQVNPGEGG